MNKDKAQVKVIQTGSYCATRLKWHAPPHNCFKVLLAPHFILLHKHNSAQLVIDPMILIGWLFLPAFFFSCERAVMTVEKQTNKQTNLQLLNWGDADRLETFLTLQSRRRRWLLQAYSFYLSGHVKMFSLGKDKKIRKQN